MNLYRGVGCAPARLYRIHCVSLRGCPVVIRLRPETRHSALRSAESIRLPENIIRLSRFTGCDGSGWHDGRYNGRP